jgi:hypothetical protein
MNTSNQFQIALKNEIKRLETLSRIASPYVPISGIYRYSRRQNRTRRSMWSRIAATAHSFSMFF